MHKAAATNSATPEAMPEVTSSGGIVPGGFNTGGIATGVSGITNGGIVGVTKQPVFLESPDSVIGPTQAEVAVETVFQVSTRVTGGSNTVESVPGKPGEVPIGVGPGGPNDYGQVGDRLGEGPVVEVETVL